MILSDRDIQQFMNLNEIIIRNFSNELEPASYDLRVGNKGITSEGIVDIEKREYLKIPRGVSLVIYPMEKIQLGTKIAATFGLRSKFARKGLILLSGPQIDPGFRGILTLTLFNAGTSEIIVRYNEKIATVVFHLLRTPSSRKYQGPYQEEEVNMLSDMDIDFATKKYKNLSDIEKELSSLQIDYNNSKTFINVVLGGVLAGAVIFFFSQLAKINISPFVNELFDLFFSIIFYQIKS